ncbi:prolyl oligopeptidase family serine peptidase [Chitinophaga filiformis]|uniref:S9 family peptidase n=1 Tax=Chitinophaga filiformis TaxID=104663 RepID=UPI001F2A2ADF|nr:prolyl oligopeptidase family serine peptidase [Chitinophaga filiformis]MCF6402602.1 prolyl oligopeptidase family serine peptidase [Chitinophaga filiformis]MCF6403480.1 prolyl oligopeptidase family serine peptidase [Chitinophaga filiformis]
MIRSILLSTTLLLHIYCVNAQQFTMEAVTSYPFPSLLTSASTGSSIAWALNEQGKRNVYVATGPDFTPRKLTGYTQDDGQEISSLSISSDGKWVVYTRGGDHGGKESSNPVNATHQPIPPKTEVWSVPFAGGTAKVLSEGDFPVISPRGDSVAFIKGGQIWIAPTDGAAPARNLLTLKGSCHSIVWAPDGSGLAFANNRNDHSYIGVYRNAGTPLQWMAPGFSKDFSPRWSPNGKQIAFIRIPGTGGATDSLLARRHQPWAIWTADVASGEGRLLWKAPVTLRGSIPTTDGGTNLNWPVNDRIVFLSYHDGWPHLYSIAPGGGTPLLLTPGAFMAEHIEPTSDGKWIVFSANTGSTATDIDRRHLARVPVDKAAMEILTSGDGIETYPVVTGDGQTIATFAGTAQQPLLPAVMPFQKGVPSVIGKELLPGNFPAAQMVTPKPVTFKAPDGTLVHAQLFEPKNKAAKHPAVVYIHGGPQRQMLLGWHYMDYYANAYAVNQYLASQGFIVLSVNYRLGIGYGYEFHKPPHAGIIGASEYQDIKAAGEWLAAQPQVDAKKIGVYGGSYGGFLTAHALGRDSKLFAAGVDVHGVHNRTQFLPPPTANPAPDVDTALKVSWLSSPVAYVSTWTSPVLLIHADDDRNVDFGQTIDLFRRLEDKGVPFEYLAIPDDTHHWMKYSNGLTVDKATSAFLIRHLKK